MLGERASLGFLRVRASEIVDANGEVVRLRGFCLGGWMNMENFIAGYPGHESGMRAAVAQVLGETRAKFFFQRFLHHFIAEDDLRFVRELGCNVIRVPLNYRHFESDDKPFEYRPEGFELLDSLIGWARTQQLYVILDLHAVQGWQNGGWHCDNTSGVASFWGQRCFEDRAVALWEELARRYRDEPIVAGYNVMNEPDAEDARWLNRFYRRVTAAIRAIDSRHILFLEGNRYSQQFHELDEPVDDNAVYSSHNYVVPAVGAGEYPGEFEGEFYDRERLERQYVQRTAYMRRHGVPHWLGEFGCLRGESSSDESRLRVMEDLIGIADGFGDHWTIWTYKDIGKMGLVSVNAESEWMRRTSRVREAKAALSCDCWAERRGTQTTELIQQISEGARVAAGDLPGDWENLERILRRTVCYGVLSRTLLPAFAEQFRGMTEEGIDQVMESFALSNCVQWDGLAQLIRVKLQQG